MWGRRTHRQGGCLFLSFLWRVIDLLPGLFRSLGGFACDSPGPVGFLFLFVNKIRVKRRLGVVTGMRSGAAPFWLGAFDEVLGHSRKALVRRQQSGGGIDLDVDDPVRLGKSTPAELGPQG